MDTSADPRFQTLSSVRKALKEAGIDTSTGEASGEQVRARLAKRMFVALFPPEWAAVFCIRARFWSNSTRAVPDGERPCL